MTSPTHPNTEKFLRGWKELLLDGVYDDRDALLGFRCALSALEVALDALDRLEVGRFIDADNIARKAQAKIEEILRRELVWIRNLWAELRLSENE